MAAGDAAARALCAAAAGAAWVTLLCVACALTAWPASAVWTVPALAVASAWAGLAIANDDPRAQVAMWLGCAAAASALAATSPAVAWRDVRLWPLAVSGAGAAFAAHRLRAAGPVSVQLRRPA
jgi:hypothetical protein